MNVVQVRNSMSPAPLCVQVLDNLSQVNVERQRLEGRVAKFWSERQEILLEAEVRDGGRGRGRGASKEGEGGERWELGV